MAMAFAHTAEGGENVFTDVSEGMWFYPYVTSCVRYGWISGYPDGTFRPDSSITRSEVTTIVNRMLGRRADAEFVQDNADRITQFQDLYSGHWAYYEIMEATNSHDYDWDEGSETWTGLTR